MALALVAAAEDDAPKECKDSSECSKDECCGTMSGTSSDGTDYNVEDICISSLIDKLTADDGTTAVLTCNATDDASTYIVPSILLMIINMYYVFWI